MPLLHIQPIFILVEPQMGENIGATARAMLNCGLNHMRIVNPRDGWPNEKAEAMSAGAFSLMPEIEVFSNLSAALADCNFTLSSAANVRDMVKPVVTPRWAANEMAQRLTAGQKVAILLGRERSGLTNDEISMTNAMISIPVNENFNSLNIGQAALIFAYEFAQHLSEAPDHVVPTGKTGISTGSELDVFCNRLDHKLNLAGFYRAPELRPLVSRNLRNFFMRAEPTSQEINTLHGVITVLSNPRDEK